MRLLPELREFLLKNGTIYTVRKYVESTGPTEIPGVGTCFRTFLGKVTTEDTLRMYINDSGFPSLQAWQRMIRLFTKTGDSLYLYKVQKLEGDTHEDKK